MGWTRIFPQKQLQLRYMDPIRVKGNKEVVALLLRKEVTLMHFFNGIEVLFQQLSLAVKFLYYLKSEEFNIKVLISGLLYNLYCLAKFVSILYFNIFKRN